MVTEVPFTMHVPGVKVTDSEPTVCVVGDAEQGCVVVVVVGSVVVVVVVVVGFFLLAVDSGTVLADTDIPVPTKTAPTTMAPTPNTPNLFTTDLGRIAVPLFPCYLALSLAQGLAGSVSNRDGVGYRQVALRRSVNS
jgi:hypothetical protein